VGASTTELQLKSRQWGVASCPASEVGGSRWAKLSTRGLTACGVLNALSAAKLELPHKLIQPFIPTWPSLLPTEQPLLLRQPQHCQRGWCRGHPPPSGQWQQGWEQQRAAAAAAARAAACRTQHLGVPPPLALWHAVPQVLGQPGHVGGACSV